MKYISTQYLLIALITAISIISCKQDDKLNVETSPGVLEKNPIEVKEKSSSIAEKINYDGKVEITKINYKTLESLLMEMINRERNKMGIRPLSENKNLAKAAAAHNQYMISNDILAHDEKNQQTSDVVKRVKIAGGQFNRVGENVQFSGFAVRTSNGNKEVISPSYIDAATDLYENWKNSPGHYRNLIDKNFNYCGTSIGWSNTKNALFATQVYGG